MNSTWLTKILILLSLLTHFSGCGLDIVEENYTTEIEIPAFTGTPQPIEKSKTYKFSGNLDRLDSLRFLSISLTPADDIMTDLSFIAQLELYVEYNNTLILVAKGTGFEPGNPSGSLEIVYPKNLKSLIVDKRLHMTWIMTPNKWFREWPDEAFKIKIDCIFEVDVGL